MKTDPARDPDEYNPYMLAPSQVPAGEIPGGPTPKELEEHEIEYILQCFEDAARRAISAGLDGVEFHIAHGYLPWQFLSPFYNKRNDRWGGSYENRLRFSIEAMRRIRKRIGDRPFIGYRINSTSFWEGDLEIEDIKRIHADFEKELDIDYVSVSAGVHHSWIHTPMTFEEGWEREYTRAIKIGGEKAGAAGRAGQPSGRCRRTCRLRRRRRHFAGAADDRRRAVDDQGERGARERHSPLRRRQLLLAGGDPRQPRAVRLQSGGRARAGVGRKLDDARSPSPKRVLVIGAGPAGLEYARVAAARGNQVVVYERERQVGGHVRAYGALPNRQQYGTIATWLAEQARGNGAVIKTGSPVTAENHRRGARRRAARIMSWWRPARATGATDFKARPRKPMPGWESGPLRHLGRSGARQGHRFRRGAGDRRNGRRRRAAHGGQTGAARRQGQTAHQMADDRLGDGGGSLSPLGTDLSV